MKTPARFASAIALMALAGYAVFALLGPHGVGALVEKQAEIRKLEERNAGLAKEIERKKERIKRLSDSDSEQELEIRDRLKLIRPDEKSYIIGDPAKK